MIYQFKADKTNSNLNFNINLQKDKRVYCFIGENGVGKTQLLESMARSALYSHSLLKNKGSYYERFYLEDSIHEEIKNLKLYLAQGISLNGMEIKNKERDSWNVAPFFDCVTILKSLEIKNPIVFIGAKNRGYAKNIDANNIQILGDKNKRFLSAFLKSYNYMNSLKVDEVTAADWFMSRLVINRNFVYGQEKTDDDVVLVCKLLQDLEPIKLKNIAVYNQKNNDYDFNIGFHEGKLLFNGIPFDKLSTGYISIIKIFQDIIDAYSSCRLNDNDKIEDTEGIVFIDEIEAHLHPKWEQSIIPFLKNIFLKLLFI